MFGQAKLGAALGTKGSGAGKGCDELWSLGGEIDWVFLKLWLEQAGF